VHDTYLQNSSSGTAGSGKYESANNMADIDDEIKDYIAKMASASATNDDVVANMHEADKKKDTEMADMAAQIKQLTASIAKLASRGQQNTENDDPNKASWPGLTPEAIAKHFPESDETLKGHARKTKSGQRSTKRTPGWEGNLIDEHNADAEAVITRPTTKERNIFVQIYNAEEDEALLKIYTDQTGRFPQKSSRGNQYIMVLVELDSNTILVERMKDRTSGEMICAYQHLVDRLKTAGILPKHHVLDNKCSADFKAAITNNQMTYQLVPPNDHHRNIAEKAIQTCKAHFISIICGADKSFPLHLWCQLLPQAEHTLNMLRPSRMTPTVSAFTYLWGQHDYNANPYAPLGCKVEAYLYPGIRESWAPHTASGYYLRNSKEHYQCHQIYTSDTRHTRVCDTVFFKHKYLTMPTITSADAIFKAADNLVDAISGVIPKNSITEDAILQLMAIYCKQALDASDAESAQRVLRRLAETQRVQTKQGTEHNKQSTNEQRVPTEQVDKSPRQQSHGNAQRNASSPVHLTIHHTGRI
jgi:hypothetical protein